ncbi:hypothetical protein HDU98_002850, partial [Podochytrium sp. JEL0797]
MTTTCSSVGSASCSLQTLSSSLSMNAFQAPASSLLIPGSYWALNTAEYKVEVTLSSLFSESLGKNATVVSAITMCCGTGAARNIQTYTAAGFAYNSGQNEFVCCPYAQATSSNCDGQHAIGQTTIQPQTNPVQNIQVNQIQYFGSHGISGLCFQGNAGCKDVSNIAECGACSDCSYDTNSVFATSTLLTTSATTTSRLATTTTLAVPTKHATTTTLAMTTKHASTAPIHAGNSTCASVADDSCSLINDNKPALTLDAFGAIPVDFSTPGSYWALNTLEYKVEVLVLSLFSESLGRNATVVSAVTLCCGTGAARNTRTFTALDFAYNSGLNYFACCPNAKATSSNCDGQHAIGQTTIQPQTNPVQNIQVNQIQYFGSHGISGLCFQGNAGCKDV